MAQQKNQSRFTSILVTYLIAFAAFQLYFHFFGPKQAPTPERAQAGLAESRRLEREGRNPGPGSSKADRIKKLEQAAQRFEEHANQHKDTLEGWQARYHQINIYDYLGGLERTGSTHWYDQAETKLKEMEQNLLGKTGTVKLEINGRVEERTGDLGKIASDRLNSIRAARDAINRPKITWQLLNFLVAATGHQPAFSYSLALLFVVVFLKTLTFPFLKKQYRYQQDMMRVAPLVKEAQEKFKGRPPEEINRRVFEIYKENNVNIAAGCLPMLVMGFSLFPVFWMIRDYEYQFTNATFLWVGTEFAKQQWWLADNLAQFDAILFLLYIGTTIIYSLMQPKPVDPQQAQQQKMMMWMMPLMFGVFMWMYRWSSAFMLYWLVLNLVSMYQSWILNQHFRKAGGAGGSGGGVPEAAPPPTVPLEPMEKVRPKRARNGSRGRGARGPASGLRGRVQPRRTDR